MLNSLDRSLAKILHSVNIANFTRTDACNVLDKLMLLA